MDSPWRDSKRKLFRQYLTSKFQKGRRDLLAAKRFQGRLSETELNEILRTEWQMYQEEVKSSFNDAISSREFDDLLEIEGEELRHFIQMDDDSHFCIIRASKESSVDLSDLAAMDLSCKICGYEIFLDQDVVFNETILETFSRILDLHDEHNRMMNIDQVLRNTLSAEQNLREDASHRLEQMASENLAQYSFLLCQTLANETADSAIRSAAGLALKNAFRARDHKKLDAVVANWSNIDQSIKTQIKNAVLYVLASKDSHAASVSAQVVQAIASIELPRGLWPELITSLLSNMTDKSSTSNLKKATLQTIGFVCEELDPEVLASSSDQILTAVIQGARKEEQDNIVRKEAINALYNSLEFVERNFDVKQERDYIMMVLLDALEGDILVSAAAFQCLVRVVQLYYSKMKEYMIAGLYHKTVKGMQSPHSEIALQAIEFWSTVCDVEIDISELLIDEQGQDFASTAVADVIPVLYSLLNQKEDDDDEEDWNVSMAAATCLNQFALCVRDIILQPHTRILELIQKDLVSENSKNRDCALLAFGSIMEGPLTESMMAPIKSALPYILKMLKDLSIAVRDSATFTVQKICQHHAQAIEFNVFDILIESLREALVDRPRVAANAAWAIMYLSDSYKELGISLLSKPFTMVAQSLLVASNRPDSSEKNLRLAAYNSLSSLIHVAGDENMKAILEISNYLIQNLGSTLTMSVVSIEDQLGLSDLQSLICTFLMHACSVLNEHISPLSQSMMAVFIEILGVNRGKKTPLLEDVFLSIGALSNAIGKEFKAYADRFLPFLGEALTNHEEEQLCSVAIGLTGDLARALESDIYPYCDTLAELLLRILQNENVGRDLKTSALSTYGDLAMAIGPKFDKYVDVTVGILFQAGSIQVDTTDPDDYDYIQDLYSAILETFANFIQGMKGPNGGSMALFKWIPGTLQFINFISSGENSLAVHKAAVGLLGDICDAYGTQVSEVFRSNPWSLQYVEKYANSPEMGDPQTQEIARWAKTVISNII